MYRCLNEDNPYVRTYNDTLENRRYDQEYQEAELMCDDISLGNRRSDQFYRYVD